MFSPRSDNPSTFDLQPPTYNIRKRVLFVTYYFPPSGGPGVQRALKLVKYLPGHRWQPTVLTVRPGAAAFPDRDETLLGEVPDAARVERTTAWDPYALYARFLGKEKDETVGVGFTGEGRPGWKERLARWVRANVFLPDARVGWVPFAVGRGRRLLQKERFDAVVTTGPPHSTHLAGLLLAQLTGTPWTADLRDPWTEIDYADKLPTTAPARWLDAALERRVLRRADAVTTVTPSWRERLRERAGLDQPDERFVTIRNGFDPADFATPAPPLGEHFTLVHAGNLGPARDPQALWQALARLSDDRKLPTPRVRLIGNVDPVVRESARRAGVDDQVAVEGYGPHAEAVRAQRRAALNLLVIDRAPNQEGRVPVKLYEQLAGGRPVLGLGPPGGDAAQLLEETGAGRMFAPDDAEGVRRFLDEHRRAWATSELPTGAPSDAVAPFSRDIQAGQLATLLDRLRRP